MATERQKAITEYMNSRCTNRLFTPFEVQMIESVIVREKELRDRRGIVINSRTKAGKLLLNQRIADMVNKAMNFKPGEQMKPEHIRLYRQCWADEYTDRTGKCAWGFKDVREKMGFDPVTGLEVG